MFYNVDIYTIGFIWRNSTCWFVHHFMNIYVFKMVHCFSFSMLPVSFLLAMGISTVWSWISAALPGDISDWGSGSQESELGELYTESWRVVLDVGEWDAFSVFAGGMSYSIVCWTCVWCLLMLCDVYCFYFVDVCWFFEV